MQAILGVILLMLNVFIDGTHLANDGGAKAVPVYLSLGNTDSSSARQLSLSRRPTRVHDTAAEIKIWLGQP